MSGSAAGVHKQHGSLGARIVHARIQNDREWSGRIVLLQLWRLDGWPYFIRCVPTPNNRFYGVGFWLSSI